MQDILKRGISGSSFDPYLSFLTRKDQLRSKKPGQKRVNPIAGGRGSDLTTWSFLIIAKKILDWFDF